MLGTKGYAGLIVPLGGAFVALLLLSGCMTSRPELHANIANGAHDIPLQAKVEIVADAALIDHAVLERVDAPADPIPLEKTAKGAELTANLLPDARYRIVATALPASKTSLPWDSTPVSQISLETTFDTVETPVLQAADDPLPLLRDKPLLLRFSQPLAQASVAGADATASIDTKDPKVVMVQVQDPSPGADLSLKLTDVVGKNGVTAPDTWVEAQAPTAVKLAGVSGKTPSGRIGLAADAPVTLDWNKPVTTVRYQVDDETKTWNGQATDTVRLPVKPAEGSSQKITVLDAVAADGGWLPAQQTFDLVSAPPLKLVAMWPEKGAENITPSSPPVFRFSEDIEDRSAAEAAINFEPSVPGSFEWLAGNKVQFVPDKAFPSNSEIKVSVDSNPHRIRGVSGGFLEDAVTYTYSTGKMKVIDVSLSKQVMTLYEDDQVVWSAPVATGVAAAPTPPGDYRVQYKMPVARFRGTNPDGSRYDIPDVHWVMPFYGDYTIHGAYWRARFGTPGSDGCISLTDANAKHVYDWAEEGTPLHVHI